MCSTLSGSGIEPRRSPCWGKPAGPLRRIAKSRPDLVRSEFSGFFFSGMFRARPCGARPCPTTKPAPGDARAGTTRRRLLSRSRGGLEPSHSYVDPPRRTEAPAMPAVLPSSRTASPGHGQAEECQLRARTATEPDLRRRLHRCFRAWRRTARKLAGPSWRSKINPDKVQRTVLAWRAWVRVWRRAMFVRLRSRLDIRLVQTFGAWRELAAWSAHQIAHRELQECRTRWEHARHRWRSTAHNATGMMEGRPPWLAGVPILMDRTFIYYRVLRVPKEDRHGGDVIRTHEDIASGAAAEPTSTDSQ